MRVFERGGAHRQLREDLSDFLQASLTTLHRLDGIESIASSPPTAGCARCSAARWSPTARPHGWAWAATRPPIYELGTWWFDRAHVRMELLEPSDHTTVCAVRGPATYWDVAAGGRRAENLAYAYAHAPAGWENLRSLITFRWNDIDHWYEEDARGLRPPPRAQPPHRRVPQLTPCPDRPRRRLAGRQGRPLALFETGMPIRWYIPRADVALERLTPSATRTQCPYKGIAEYYSIPHGHRGDRRISPGPTRTRCRVPAHRAARLLLLRARRHHPGRRPQPRPLTKWEHAIPERDLVYGVAR